jgi:peptide/nickel transport system substrate-binding protein/oligopeptide transport system substrate-binding protein
MKKLLTVIACLVVIAGVFAGCGEEVKKAVFKYPIPSDVPTLDPAKITDDTSHYVGKQLYEGLVTYDKDLNIIPCLATEYKVSDDGKVYTFILRETTFSNGDPLTANDFKWSFERALKPEIKSERTWIFDEIAGFEDVIAGKTTDLAGIKVIDDKTLEITIKNPSGIFLHKMTYSTAYVLDQKVVEAYENPMVEEKAEGEEAKEEPAEEEKKEETPVTTESGKKVGQWFEHEPVGTGAFKLVEWKRGQSVLMERNDGWWGYKDQVIDEGYVKVDQVLFSVMQEDTTRMLEYKNGNLDWVQIPDADFNDVKNDPVLQNEMLSVKELSVYYIGFQNKKPPFDNVKVRQAINYAVNREQIIEKLFFGRNLLANGIIPPSMPNFKSKFEGYAYDPAKAKQLLDEAVKEGAVMPEKVVLGFNTGNAVHKSVCEFIQDQIKTNLGINVELNSADWATYLKDIDNGQYPMFRLGWVADYPDPDNFLWVLLDSENAGPKGGSAFYSNPEFDKLVRAAKTEVDMAKRSAMYEEAEAIAMKEACWMPISYQTNWSLVKPRVKGYIRTAMGVLTFGTITLKAE